MKEKREKNFLLPFGSFLTKSVGDGIGALTLSLSTPFWEFPVNKVWTSGWINLPVRLSTPFWEFPYFNCFEGIEVQGCYSFLLPFGSFP